MYIYIKDVGNESKFVTNSNSCFFLVLQIAYYNNYRNFCSNDRK